MCSLTRATGNSDRPAADVGHPENGGVCRLALGSGVCGQRDPARRRCESCRQMPMPCGAAATSTCPVGSLPVRICVLQDRGQIWMLTRVSNVVTVFVRARIPWQRSGPRDIALRPECEEWFSLGCCRYRHRLSGGAAYTDPGNSTGLPRVRRQHAVLSSIDRACKFRRTGGGRGAPARCGDRAVSVGAWRRAGRGRSSRCRYPARFGDPDVVAGECGGVRGALLDRCLVFGCGAGPIDGIVRGFAIGGSPCVNWNWVEPTPAISDW